MRRQLFYNITVTTGTVTNLVPLITGVCHNRVQNVLYACICNNLLSSRQKCIDWQKTTSYNVCGHPFTLRPISHSVASIADANYRRFTGKFPSARQATIQVIVFFTGTLVFLLKFLPTVILALKIFDLSDIVLNSSQVMNFLSFLIRAKTRIFLFSNEGQSLQSTCIFVFCSLCACYTSKDYSGIVCSLLGSN